MVNIKNLSKHYKIYPSPRARLKEWLSLGKQQYHQVSWALQDINLQINKGEILGVVGRNGAGKSTLFKLIAGNTKATKGQVKVEGSVAALLELGTGFHEELSGRENITINSRLFGIDATQLPKKIAEIENFCELGEHFDRVVRTYSTGMYMRLGFALATHVDAEVLIIDEALSVGDAYFQQKCLARLRKLKKSGVSIIFASHDLGAMKLFCDRVALLHSGRLLAVGSPKEILEIYNAQLAGDSSNTKIGNGKANIHALSLKNCKTNKESSHFQVGDECCIAVTVHFQHELENPSVGILIRDRLGYDIYGTNTSRLQTYTGKFKAGEKAVFQFKLQLNLGPGSYTLTIGLHQGSHHSDECYHWADCIHSFKVVGGDDFLGVSYLQAKFSWEHHDTNRIQASSP